LRMNIVEIVEGSNDAHRDKYQNEESGPKPSMKRQAQTLNKNTATLIFFS